MHLDVRAVVDFFGGGTNMAALFKKYNFGPIRRGHFYKWKERNSIPVERWLEIEHIATKERVYKQLREIAVLTSQAPLPLPVPSVLVQAKRPSSAIKRR